MNRMRIGLCAAWLLGVVACAPTPGPGEPTTTTTVGSTTTTTTTTIPSSGRTTVDRPDQSSLLQVKALYVVPSDGVDRQFDTNGRIATSVESVQRWFQAQGGSRLRFDTFNGSLDIAFLRLASTTAQIAALESPLPALRDAIAAAGFTDSKKSYVMFYEGQQPGVCGSAYRPGRQAGIYLHTSGCDEIGMSLTSPRWMDYTVIHEIFHNLGASPDCAPNKSTSGHVGDVANDLMYSGPLPRPLPRVLDANRDDYWGHGRVDCVDVRRSTFLDPLPAGVTGPAVVSTTPGPEVQSAAP